MAVLDLKCSNGPNVSEAAGFTLVEVLVSLAVVGLVFTAVLKLYALSLSMDIRTRFYAQAPLVAQAVLGEVQVASLESGSIQGGLDNVPQALLPSGDYGVKLERIPLEDGGLGLTALRCTIRLKKTPLVYSASLLEAVAP